MTFVLDLLAETLQNRREEIEATENAELEPAPWDVVRSAVGDEMIDPALRSEPQGAPQTGPHRQHPDGTPAQRKAKYACIVKEACNTYGLRGSKRLEVQDFSALDVSEQQIVVFALMQGVRRDLAHREARGYLTISNFKDQAVIMLRILLLAPTNKSYVCPEVKRFLKADIVEHYESWGLLQSTVEDPDALKELLRVLGRKLTEERNNIKETLAKAAAGNYCINRLMNELAPEDMFVTDKHRERWAWVLAFYKNHVEQVKRQETKDLHFWNNLDKALSELEDHLKDKPDLDERGILRERIFSNALRKHSDKYPTQAAARNTPHDAPSWQLALEARLARKHNYATAPPA